MPCGRGGRPGWEEAAMELSAQEAEIILSLQERALTCANFSGIPQELLAPSCDYLKAATGCFLQISFDPLGRVKFGRTAAFNVSAAAHEGYLDHHFESDPAIAAASRNSGRLPYVFCTSEIFDYAELTNSPFYNDFFRPNRIHHVMAMAQRPHGPEGDIMLLGFHRPSNDRPFSEADKLRLRRLGAALGSAVRLLCLDDVLALRDCAVAEYESEFEHGLLLLDERMTLLYGNQTGLDHLKLNSSGGLARLERLARCCRQASRQSEKAEAITTNFGETEDVVAKVRARRDGEGRLLFAIHTNERMAEAIFLKRCRQIDLSMREIDISRALAAGLSNGEIADRLFISIRTVENHLRSVYMKAGVNRRTQLLSRLNSCS